MNTGKVVSKNLDDAVTNEHLGKCVKVCLTNIQVTKSQSNMETWACKYGILNSLLFMKIGWKNGLLLVHMSVIWSLRCI